MQQRNYICLLKNNNCVCFSLSSMRKVGRPVRLNFRFQLKLYKQDYWCSQTYAIVEVNGPKLD